MQQVKEEELSKAIIAAHSVLKATFPGYHVEPKLAQRLITIRSISSPGIVHVVFSSDLAIQVTALMESSKIDTVSYLD